MSKKSHLVWPALGLAALAGCGGAADSATTAAATSTATTPATAAAAPAKPAPAEKAAVTIKDFEYGPAKTTVAKGATVRWTNVDEANHTVTFDSGAKTTLGNQATGSKKSMRFTKAGTYAYHCDYHPNMHGTVVVR